MNLGLNKRERLIFLFVGAFLSFVFQKVSLFILFVIVFIVFTTWRPIYGFFFKRGMRWNPKAIDYSVGVDPHDLITGKTYTQEEARRLPKKIKGRLINKPRKVGCWVKK